MQSVSDALTRTLLGLGLRASVCRNSLVLSRRANRFITCSTRLAVVYHAHLERKQAEPANGCVGHRYASGRHISWQLVLNEMCSQTDGGADTNVFRTKWQALAKIPIVSDSAHSSHATDVWSCSIREETSKNFKFARNTQAQQKCRE